MTHPILSTGGGGFDAVGSDSSNSLAVVDTYDSSTGLWTSTRNGLADARYDLAAAVAAGITLIGGGMYAVSCCHTIALTNTQMQKHIRRLRTGRCLWLPGHLHTIPTCGSRDLRWMLLSSRCQVRFQTHTHPGPPVLTEPFGIFSSLATAYLTLSAGQTLFINGSLTILSSLTMMIASSLVPPLTVAGSASISGTFTLQLGDAFVVNGTVVPIITAENITGSFSTIRVVAPCPVAAEPRTDGASLLLLLGTASSSCSSPAGLSDGAIAGIVVGSIVGAAVLIGIAIFLAIRFRLCHRATATHLIR